MISTPLVKRIIWMALKEDIGAGDVTTNSLVPKGAKARARLYAREDGIIAGLDIAIDIFRHLDGNIKAEKFVEDGAKVRKNQPLAEIRGSTRALLSGERTALNFLQSLSGVATLTGKYVDVVKPCRVKILTTRKTTPLLRILDKYAVRVGKGQNHRMGLYDMAMVKDNHLKIQMQNAKCKMKNVKVTDIVKTLRRKIPKGMRIEVEAKNIREVRAALESGADIIMLDNMHTRVMRKAVNLIHRSFGSHGHVRPMIEASGNVGLHNVKTIAKTGVDWISIGRLTHSAPALDISLEIV